MIFYLGTHMVNHAKEFEYSFISINRLRNRKSDFSVNKWILDSGAFTEISAWGKFRTSVHQYANEIERWSKCGQFELAVTQDYMCEPFIVKKTGLSVTEHQRLTIQRYDELSCLISETIILPVLQGYQVEDYLTHLEMWGDRLWYARRIGVGSVCKRNTNILAITRILDAIKTKRPDLRLHGFGLKTTALRDSFISSLLFSADSMAWSYAARKNVQNANGLNEAKKFYMNITSIKNNPSQMLLSLSR